MNFASENFVFIDNIDPNHGYAGNCFQLGDTPATEKPNFIYWVRYQGSNIGSNCFWAYNIDNAADFDNAANGADSAWTKANNILNPPWATIGSRTGPSSIGGYGDCGVCSDGENVRLTLTITY
jgi:hypothetical protein